MGDGDFIPSLVEYDKSQLKEGMMKNVKGLLKKLESSGIKEPDQLKRMSSAASGLMKFVVAIVSYYEVAKVVEPEKKAAEERAAKEREEMLANETPEQLKARLKAERKAKKKNKVKKKRKVHEETKADGTVIEAITDP